MSVPQLTLFNNKGGVGKTSLIYHLSWMFSELDYRVVAIDLDPQANLTSAFLNEDELEKLWESDEENTTVYKCVEPLIKVGDIIQPATKCIGQNLFLVPGDLALAGFEDALSSEWPDSMGDKNLYRPFRILTAFWQVAQMAADHENADIILADVGPNLGAINRSALIASDFIIIPLGADLYSLQGLKNIGPTLKSWQNLWNKRLDNWGSPDFKLPEGKMETLGYIIQQHSVRLSRPVKSYEKWVNRIPEVYREYILEDITRMRDLELKPDQDPYCLATIKHFRSLVPMAQETRKPVFNLTSSDGAIGAHTYAAQEAYRDFKNLAEKIIKKIDLKTTESNDELGDV